MTGALANPFRSLRHRNYRIWAAGALISNIGTWVQRTAQDWLVFTELTHHDASTVGIVMGLQFAPQLLLLPWTGSAADQFNQRKLLIATQATMGALSLVLGALTLLGIVQLWHVYVLAFLFGCAAAFDAPVRQTFVSELVGDEDLPNAVALNSTSFNAARMIGPAVSGVVIAGFGTGWAFLIDGMSFIAVLVSLGFLGISDLRRNARASRAKGSFVEGLVYVRQRPDLMAILIMLFLIGTFGLNFPIFIATMAVDVFHVDASGYGLLSSIMAIGTMAGALLSGSRDQTRFRGLPVAAAIFGASCAGAAIAPGYWLFSLALIIIGISALMFSNLTNSLMQLSTNPAMRGRVMALRVAVALGATPIGAPIVGWVADHYGPPWALAVGAVSGFAAALVGLYAMYRRLAGSKTRPEDGKPRD